MVVGPFLATIYAIVQLWQRAVDWPDLALLVGMYIPLTLGVTGGQRLADPSYRGRAATVHEYVVESVVAPSVFVVPGYPERTMPEWYGAKLSALALEKIAEYLEHQTGTATVP